MYSLKLHVWIFCRYCNLSNECEQLKKDHELYLMKVEENKGQELGQAHHMFSRFLNLWIYDFFHEIFFVLFLNKFEVFYRVRKCHHTRKRHFAALKKMKHKRTRSSWPRFGAILADFWVFGFFWIFPFELMKIKVV